MLVCWYLAGNIVVPVTCVHVAPSLELQMSFKGTPPLYPAITHILLLNTTLVCPYLAGKPAIIVASVQYTPGFDTGVGAICVGNGVGTDGTFKFLHPEIAAKNIIKTKKVAVIFFILKLLCYGHCELISLIINI